MEEEWVGEGEGEEENKEEEREREMEAFGKQKDEQRGSRGRKNC